VTVLDMCVSPFCASYYVHIVAYCIVS